ANSILEENKANRGGGIFDDGQTSTLTIINSTLKNNSASFAGGGIFNHAFRLTITNSTLSGNKAERLGGGILTEFQEANLKITNSTLSDNSVVNSQPGDGMMTGGGGIFNLESRIEITNSTLSGNSASNESHTNITAVGGGIGSTSDALSTITIMNSTL